MAATESALAVTVAGGTLTFAGWWAGLDPSVVIGAFTGAVFFAVSSVELTRWARLFYFFVSFVFGVLTGPYLVGVIIVPGAATAAPDALGALIAAAIAVKLLLSLSVKGALGGLSSLAGAIAETNDKQRATKDHD